MDIGTLYHYLKSFDRLKSGESTPKVRATGGELILINIYSTKSERSGFWMRRVLDTFFHSSDQIDAHDS